MTKYTYNNQEFDPEGWNEFGTVEVPPEYQYATSLIAYENPNVRHSVFDYGIGFIDGKNKLFDHTRDKYAEKGWFKVIK